MITETSWQVKRKNLLLWLICYSYQRVLIKNIQSGLKMNASIGTWDIRIFTSSSQEKYFVLECIYCAVQNSPTIIFSVVLCPKTHTKSYRLVWCSSLVCLSVRSWVYHHLLHKPDFIRHVCFHNKSLGNWQGDQRMKSVIWRVVCMDERLQRKSPYFPRKQH